MSAASVGLWALWGAIAAAGLATIAPWAFRRRPGATRRLLGLSTLLALISTLGLLVALLTSDFSVDYVVRTTSLATPWPYRLAALWGGMEGSLLFYASLTLLVGWAAGHRFAPDLVGPASQVIAMVGGGLLLLTALSASPFSTLELPAVDGEGLLAILQHPAMVYHPPILYLGLTSLVIPFALTVASVGRGRIDRAWVRSTRRWLLAPWLLLAVGMAAGANWAYVELGWGGFWAWDPVENTALMPWLAATAFLHTGRIAERDGRLMRWNVAFALLPFVLTLLGVYLTRSGATGSIHSFAESPVIGRILLVAAVAGLILACWLTGRAAKGEPWERAALLGRDTWLAGSAGLLTIALVFVTVGSAYPAYLQVFFDERAMVGSRFFVTAILPIAMVIALGLAHGFHTGWVPRPISAGRLILYSAVTGVSALSAIFWLGGSPPGGVALLGLASASFLFLALDMARSRPSRRALSGHLAHLGMALVLVGAAGSSLGEDFTAAMAPGETLDAGRHEVTLRSIDTGEADRYIFVSADVLVARQGGDGVELTPEIRAYEAQALPVPEPALHATPWEDIVVAISRVADDASVVEVSVFVRPLVAWVWVGALLIALAGAWALVVTSGGDAGRHRPARARRRPAGTTTSS